MLGISSHSKQNTMERSSDTTDEKFLLNSKTKKIWTESNTLFWEFLIIPKQKNRAESDTLFCHMIKNWTKQCYVLTQRKQKKSLYWNRCFSNTVLSVVDHSVWATMFQQRWNRCFSNTLFWRQDYFQLTVFQQHFVLTSRLFSAYGVSATHTKTCTH